VIRLALRSSLLVLAGVASVGTVGPSTLAAQGSEVLVEVGGSTFNPPAGVEGDAAQFLSAGIRATGFSANGSGIFASFLAGRALDEANGGDFLALNLEGALWRDLSRGWSGGFELKGFGFDVGDPFPYRSVGFEGGPSLRFSSPNITALIRGVGGSGWSRTRLSRYAEGPAVTVEDGLWRYGATAEVLAGTRRVMGGVAGGIHETAGGTYRSAGLRLLAEWGGPALEMRADVWQTPLGNQTTGGLAFILPFGGWSLRGFLGRTEPDPLTLAEPGGGSGGILLGRRVLGRDPLPPARPPLHEVVEQEGSLARVRIHVRPPRGSGTVQVLGDFTLWEPVGMEKEGTAWIVELEIPAGTHHFGFLVDGSWFLPEDAPDAVPDEWGRRNATLVIEG
jgi:hypothetical protein